MKFKIQKKFNIKNLKIKFKLEYTRNLHIKEILKLIINLKISTK